MTFQQLSYFLEVSKHGSVSAAAKKLYVSQSTISNAIIALEAEVGQPVFIRSGKGLTLTPRGERVLVYAKRILESKDLITSQKAPKKQSVKVACIHYTPAENAFLRLLDEIPDISQFELAMYDSRFGSFTDGLISCELDIAITFVISTNHEQVEKVFENNGLYYEKLTSIPVSVCIGPGHPLYNEPCVNIEALGDTALLDSADKKVSQTGAFRGHLRIHSSRAIVACPASVRQRLLQSGLVYAITHMRSAKERSESSRRYIPLNGMNYYVYAAMDTNRPHAPEVYRYLELLKEEIAAYTL